jgi:hypothetical protein
MKKFILVFMLLMPVVAYAEPCPDIEYAELKDMSQVSFEKKFCDTVREKTTKLNIWKKVNTEITWEDMKSCNDLSKKMAIVYKERFKKEIPMCVKDDTKK